MIPKNWDAEPEWPGNRMSREELEEAVRQTEAKLAQQYQHRLFSAFRCWQNRKGARD